MHCIANGKTGEVNLYGRNLFCGAENADEFINVMSGFEVRFRGTRLTAEMKTLPRPRINPNKPMFSTWSVFIDGARDPVERMLSARSEEWAEYTLAEGLAEGEHVVMAVKTDDPLVSSCLVRGYRTDGAFLPRPARPALRMEAFGDSITTGGDNMLGDRPSEDVVPENMNGAATYAAYAAYELGAELNVFARCGICLYGANEGDTVNVVSKIYDRVSPMHAEKWELRRYIPSVVVIGLGTNDQFGNMAGFSAAYAQFVRELAAAYGKETLFVLVHGFADLAVNQKGERICPPLADAVADTARVLRGEGYSVRTLRFDPAPRFHPLYPEHRRAGLLLAETIRAALAGK